MLSGSRRLRPLVTALAMLVAGDAVAGEDGMIGTREDRARELAHRIDLRLGPGYATMTARRTVYNAAARADEVVYSLAIPARSVATGLRVRGDGSRWLPGALLPAEEADARYLRLTGMDPAVPASLRAKDPTLLAWDGTGWLSLHMFPVAAGGSRTVEYTVDMPLTRVDGRWQLELEETGLADMPAELLVRAARAGDRLFVDGAPVGQGHRLLLDDWHSVELAPRSAPAVALELAAVPVGTDTFVHWRVSLGEALAPVPRGIRMVVALDLSRSLPDGAKEAQRRAAIAALEHLRRPGLQARVAILGFDRHVRPWTDGFVSVARALAVLTAAPLDGGNGSDVALALRGARDLFAAAPADAPRRVLLLTDFQTASSRTLAEHAAAAAGTRAIVHLAAVADDGPRLVRDDGHPWADVAARTQGVVWRAGMWSEPDDEDRARAAEVFEEWVRPVRVDALQVVVGQPEVLEIDSLAVGETIEAQRVLARPVERMAVRGRTWNTPWVRVARRSEALSRRWAGLAFTTSVVHALDEEAQRRLAQRGRAVTPYTSLLVVEPGVVPTRDGLVREAPGGEGLIGKGGGGGTSSGYGRGSGAGFTGRLDRQAWLRREADLLWQQCGGAGQRATLELETTREEIVDVDLRAPGDAPTRTTCMREAAWALWLPASDFVDERRAWTVALGPR